MARQSSTHQPSPPVRLMTTASWLIHELTAINSQCRRLLPEPHRSRMSSLLNATTWRMRRYLQESEAGTYHSPEAICQARMLRLTLDDAAHCCQQALNRIESDSGPASDELIAIVRHLLLVASAPIPTFPSDLNGVAYSLDMTRST